MAGATATATHGSGAANQNLAAAVAGLTLVTEDGDLVELRRGDNGFDGAVVHLGALGVVVSLILDLVPSFDVSQRVYENLPMAALDDHFADLMASGYSVSLFTDWRAPASPRSGSSSAPSAARPAAPAVPPPPAPQASWFTAVAAREAAAPGARRVAGRLYRAARRAWPLVRPAPALPARVSAQRRRRAPVGVPAPRRRTPSPPCTPWTRSGTASPRC